MADGGRTAHQPSANTYSSSLHEETGTQELGPASVSSCSMPLLLHTSSLRSSSCVSVCGHHVAAPKAREGRRTTRVPHARAGNLSAVHEDARSYEKSLRKIFWGILTPSTPRVSPPHQTWCWTDHPYSPGVTLLTRHCATSYGLS